MLGTVPSVDLATPLYEASTGLSFSSRFWLRLQATLVSPRLAQVPLRLRNWGVPPTKQVWVYTLSRWYMVVSEKRNHQIPTNLPVPIAPRYHPSNNKIVRRRYSDSLRARRSGDRILVRGNIFRTCPDGAWGPTSLLYNEYLVITRDRTAGAWRWPLTPI
jgi:hypothetical protein